MKKKMLNIFTVLMSLFAFVFILASCGDESNDTNGNNSNQDSSSKTFEKDGDKLYFGTYPQTKVEASTDNGLSSITFDASTWTSYGYYISTNKYDFMYYKDVDINNDGSYDYRGVYFTQYRPYSYSYNSSYTKQELNYYLAETIYWFKYEKIEWQILNEVDGKTLIVAKLLLDAQEYCASTKSSLFDHNGGVGCVNNYELSDIRKFLNETFYNTAFNDLQKAIIETTTVDNSLASTLDESNNYVCDNTQDKIFLLSVSEVSTYFANEEARITTGTDYAKCQGLNVSTATSYLGNSYYWLRSPHPDFSIAAYGVSVGGNFYAGSCEYTDSGIRPACVVKL